MAAITLDLQELAREWREAAEILEAPRGDPSILTADELAEAREIDERCHRLCRDLGLSPANQPDTLQGSNLTLVREDTFTDYAREYAEDVYGDGARELGWVIDWERFADSLRIDHVRINYDDHEWLVRA